MRRFWILSLFASGLVGLAGCSEHDEIKKTEVTFEDRQPLRLRVAIFKQAKLWWFIRLSGPEALVKEHEATFETFVRNVKFDDKKSPPIVVTEPKGWRKDPPGGAGRTMAFRIDAKPKELEVTIVKLGAAEQSLLANLQRWQRQMHMPETETLEEAEQNFAKRENIGDQDVWWVTLNGVGVHTVSTPPDPHAADKANKFMDAINIKTRDGEFPFTYTVPPGWVRTGPRETVKSGMTFKTLETFAIGEGQNRAEVALSMAGGPVGFNIVRWREQVGLEKGSLEEAERSAQRRTIARIKAYYVDLANPQGPAGENRILAVIIPVGSQKCFVKLTGPHDLVGQQKANFESFVDSFKR